MKIILTSLALASLAVISAQAETTIDPSANVIFSPEAPLVSEPVPTSPQVAPIPEAAPAAPLEIAPASVRIEETEAVVAPVAETEVAAPTESVVGADYTFSLE